MTLIILKEAFKGELMLELYESQEDRYGVIELINHHLKGKEATAAITALDLIDNTTYLEKDSTGMVVGLVSYFRLPIDFDVIMAMHKDNLFSKTMWKHLRKLLLTRTKEIRIQSDMTIEALHKGAARYGGYFDGNDIILPKQ